jgi:hypothetical protein
MSAESSAAPNAAKQRVGHVREADEYPEQHDNRLVFGGASVLER